MFGEEENREYQSFDFVGFIHAVVARPAKSYLRLHDMAKTVHGALYVYISFRWGACPSE